MFEKEYDIAMYGSGPATIFLANKLQQLNIKIIIIEKGEVNNINKLETIDKINGTIKFHHQNNKERASSFFGTASLWNQSGVGGKLQKFDAIDINNKWPIKFEELNLKYSEIINELSSYVNIKEDYTNIDDNINLTEFSKFFKFKYDSSRLTFKF